MTLTIRNGDLFTSDAQAYGHGVNIYGAMGAGIAKVFANRFDGLLDDYRAFCKNPGLEPGGMLPWCSKKGQWVYNMASQNYPGPFAKLEWLRSSAYKSLVHAEVHNIPVIAIPQIGCGIGGLEWEDVATVLEDVQEEFIPKFEVWVL